MMLGTELIATSSFDFIKREMAMTGQHFHSLYNAIGKLSMEHKADVIEALLANLRRGLNPLIKRILKQLELLCVEYV